MMLLKDEFGMAGYGAYWSILEAISDQLTPQKNKCSISLSVKNLRKITDFSPKKLKLFLTFLNKSDFFLIKNTENMVFIECPKLLEYRDEYTKKAGRVSG